DGARVEQRQVGHLRQRQHGAVVLHVHGVEQRRVGAPGAHPGQAALERLDRLLHLVIGVLADVGSGHAVSLVRRDQTWTSVPSSAPMTTLRSAPDLKMENTLTGRFWSRHRANA